MSLPQIKDREAAFGISKSTPGASRGPQGTQYQPLGDPGKGEHAPAELEDPVRSVELVWCLCRRQAEERKVSEQSFWESLDQDMLDAAGLAIMEGLANFSGAAIRPAMAKVAEKTTKLRELLARAVNQAVASGELDRVIDAEMEKLMQAAGSMDQGRAKSETTEPPDKRPMSCSTGALSSSASSETSTPST